MTSLAASNRKNSITVNGSQVGSSNVLARRAQGTPADHSGVNNPMPAGPVLARKILCADCVDPRPGASRA